MLPFIVSEQVVLREAQKVEPSSSAMKEIIEYAGGQVGYLLTEPHSERALHLETFSQVKRSNKNLLTVITKHKKEKNICSDKKGGERHQVSGAKRLAELSSGRCSTFSQTNRITLHMSGP